MRTEQVELTVLCLVHHDGKNLLQDRVKDDWKGYTFPGGHIEPDESIVDAVIREMKEETGLLIKQPKLCGVKQFPIEGELTDSEEGKMHWVKIEELQNVNLVEDFYALLDVMQNDSLTEFQYVIKDGEWIVEKR